MQVICNVASNNWECHSTIVRNGILNHVMFLIKSITTPDDVKRAAINVTYAMTFTPEGRTALMDMDAVIVLVPSIKVEPLDPSTLYPECKLSTSAGAFDQGRAAGGINP